MALESRGGEREPGFKVVVGKGRESADRFPPSPD